MAKSVGILFGVMYVVLGILAFFTNPLIGMYGFFVTNAAYATAFIVVGLVLLAVALWASRAQTHGWNTAIGAILILVALVGFITAPAGGTMLGFMVSMTDHWLNVIAGIIILVSGLAHRGSSAHALRTVII